jgi:hypothetical protein
MLPRAVHVRPNPHNRRLRPVLLREGGGLLLGQIEGREPTPNAEARLIPLFVQESYLSMLARLLQADSTRAHVKAATSTVLAACCTCQPRLAYRVRSECDAFHGSGDRLVNCVTESALSFARLGNHGYPHIQAAAIADAVEHMLRTRHARLNLLRRAEVLCRSMKVGMWLAAIQVLGWPW